MSDCLFCKIVAKEIPAQLVHEDSHAIVFKDISPKAPTHVLVVPKKHLDRLSATKETDAALLGHLQRVAVAVAEKLELYDFRLVTNNGRGAGQTVDHLHYHLMGGRAMQWPPG
jgi:histidine triad (HIT) family protein